MNLKKLLIASTAIYAASTSLAHAEPITIALFGAAFAATTAGQIVSLGFGLAFTFGLSLLQKTKKPDAEQTGTQIEVQMGDDQPITFIGGKFATAGRRKYIGAWGDDGKTPNAYVTDVIEVGNIPNYAGPLGITSVWIDDQLCGVLWDQPHPDGRGYPVIQYRTANGKDYLWIKYLDGTQTAADPFLRAKFGSDPDRPWNDDMIGLGCQVVILTARYNTDLFSGIPQGMYEPHPAKFYDVRKDSTNGGNGSHRWNDPGTWERTQNPAVIIYNIIRGIYYNGTWVYGGQNLAAYRLPSSNWIAAANACDARVALADGTTEPAYQAGYEFHGDEKPSDAIEKLRAACNGRLAEVGGIFKLLVGAPGGAVYAFTDNDVLVTEGQSFEPFPSLDDTVNAIEATYPEPTEKWANKDAPGRYSDTLEAQDGNRRLPDSVTFDAVPFANQVQRLMVAILQEERRFRIHQFHLPPDAYPLEPNDVVSWTSDKNGYVNKKFLVTTITGHQTFNQLVMLKEIDPSDYDWNASMQLPTATGWIGPITAPAQPMYGWSVEPSTIKDSGGIDRRPAIKISCAPDQDDVTRVWVQVRLKETGVLVFDSDSNRYDEPYSWIISGQWMISNTDYEARGRYLPKSNRTTSWSDWLPVKTPNVLIQSADVLDGSIIASKIADAAVTAAKIMDEAVTNLKLADEAVSTAKLQVAAVTADVLASGAVISTKLADGAVTAAKLAQGVVDATKLASSIKAVEVVSTLPTTGNVEGRQVFLTTDGKLYRYHNSAWTTAVASADINGTLTDAQIAAVAASKVTGQLTDDQIAAIAAAKVTGALVSSQIADAAITSSKLAALAVDATKLADASVTAAKIADAAVTTTKFANGIRPVEIVAALPTTGNIEGRMVYLTTDDKLYRYTGSAWTSATPSTDITGQLTDAQIAAVAAAKVTGTLVSSQIADAAITNSKLAALAVDATKLADASVTAAKIADAAVTTTKFANGIRPVEIVAALPTTGNIEGRMVYLTTDDKLYRYTGSAWTSATPSTDITGQLTDGQIAAVAAAKVTGTLVSSQIADAAVTNSKLAALAVDATKLADASVTAAKIADAAVTTTKFANGIRPVEIVAVLPTTGNIEGRTVYLTTDDKLYRYTGTAWTSATPATDITGQLTDAQIGAVAAAKVTGQITSTQITDGAISTPKLAAGAVTANELAANSVIAAKIAAGAVIAAAISAGAITTNAIAAGAVTATQIAANTITAGQISAGAIGATQIAAGAVTTAKLSAGAVTANELAASAVTAGKIAANAVVATNIAAGAVSAKSLQLQDFENLVPNGRWEDTTNIGDYWTPANPAQVTASYIIGGQSGSYSLQTVKSAAAVNGELRTAAMIPVIAGEVLYFETALKSGTTDTSSNGGYYRLMWFDANKAALGTQFTDIVGNKPISTDWATYSGQVTVPAGAAYAQPRLYNTSTTALTLQYDRIVLRRANAASLIVDGGITANALAAGSVTTAALAAGAVTANEIAANAVTTGKIAAGAVTAAQIAANTITAGQVAAGAIGATQIAAGAVTTAKLSAGAVTANELAANAVTAGKIAANAVVAANIAAGAITADKMVLADFTNRVENPNFADGNGSWTMTAASSIVNDPASAYVGNCYLNVGPGLNGIVSRNINIFPVVAGEQYFLQTFAKVTGAPNTAISLRIRYMQADKSTLVGTGAVTIPANGAATYTEYNFSSSVPAGAVYAWVDFTTNSSAITTGSYQIGFVSCQRRNTGSLIVDGAITAAKIAANAVTAASIAAGAITTDALAANAVTTAKIAAGAITASQIAANTITAGQIAANTLTAGQIAAGAIGATQIAADAVTTAKIAAGAVTASELAANAVTAGKISANAVVAGNVAANAITARELILQDWENLIPDNQLQSPAAWSSLNNAVVNPATTQAFSSKGAIDYTYVAGASYLQILQSQPFAVVSGQPYLASAQAIRTSGTMYGLWLRVHWLDANGNLLNPDTYVTIVSYGTAGGGTAAGMQAFSAEITPPATAFGALVRGYIHRDYTDGNVSIGGISFLRKATANLIVDGTITGTKIAATTITAGNIAAGTLTAAQIAASAITATQLAAGAVTTAKLAAGAVTANELAASAVTAGKIAANAVTSGTIAANAVTAGTIAAGAVSASQIAAGAITADKLASNAVTTNALAVGSGKNLLQNANFASGTDCWAYTLGGGSTPVTFALRQPPATWSGAAQPTLMVDKESGPDTGSTYVDVRWKRPDEASLAVVNLKYGVPCTAGESFEATAYIAAHRCICELRIEWRDATGATLGYSSVDTNNANSSSSTDPDTWPRLRTVGVAPTGAVCAGIHMRKRDTNAGQTTSYMFVNKPMLCRIPAGATEPTPWSDAGVVLITPNGIVANAVTADDIAANAVTAGKIAANAVTAGTIAAGAVTATTIAGGTITGDKLAANTIGADQIAANAITAKQLVLTDFSNMADNGWQTGTLDGWTTQNVQSFANDPTAGDAAGYVLQSLGRDCARSNFVAVTPGDVYAFDVWVKNADANVAQVTAITMTPSGTVAYAAVTSTTTKNGWVRLQGRYTVASGVSKLAMLLQVVKTAGTGSSCYWSNPVMRRAVSAELIVDGSITASAIAANAITAAQIATGAITTDKLILGGVTYDKIATGAVTAITSARAYYSQTIPANGTVDLTAAGVVVAGDGRVNVSTMTLGLYNKNGNSQSAQPINVSILRDGTVIFGQVYYLGVVQTQVTSNGGSGGSGGVTQTTYTAGLVSIPVLYDEPGAGYHVYTLRINCPDNTIVWNESNIIATAFKR
ncbi:hypothetical protein GR212_15300 [Rhizobium lusitanum]|uniref:Tip attachment protein J domain-containing protein n=1 Tax=Rhizobium lusitanum TaxID=293958 RepID=A0A6L9U6A8_9HYPH|nr:hypothetical protein [Rhizobium lusitanum]NEI70949.1 hypothetical protein [Rhizobium lusitanum]